MIINISYVLLSLLALWYLYFLLSTHSKSSRLWGRKKRVIKILKRYKGIRRNHTQRIGEMIEEIELLFIRDAQIDYRSMLEALLKIKSLQHKNNSDFYKTEHQIEIIIEEINKKHKFFYVSDEYSKLFISIEECLNNDNFDDAKKYLSILYTQCSSTEDELKNKRNKEFWIGTFIGLLGLALPFIQSILFN